MLQEVEVGRKSLDDYRTVVGDGIVDEIRALAGQLKGARVLHINATAYGGGVAEILYTMVPLMRDAGVETHWQVIVGEQQFFNVTKSFHNALQGMSIPLTSQMIEIYERNNRANAALLEDNWDFVVVHDPQPAAIRHFRGSAGGARWIWRCHLDTSAPDQGIWSYLRSPFLEPYDAAVFTMKQFVGTDLGIEEVAIIPPSIDPLSAKNAALDPDQARELIVRFGVDLTRPLLTQVCRFDPWKDPLGVIDVYRLVKAEIPEVQLALVGSMATDDPEGIQHYARTLRRAGEDFDIHILSNLDAVDDDEVNAFQTISDVIIQKSIREGFGLVVSEAMWKRKPVVGGNVGGIPLQILDGQTGFLVEDVRSCAQRAIELLRDPDLGRQMGEKGQEHVRANFLTTRHLRDYLALFLKLKD